MDLLPTRRSHWELGSTSGGGISASIPRLPTLSAGRITIPITYYERFHEDPNEPAGEKATLSGYGLGVSYSLLSKLKVPVQFNPPAGFGFSTPKAPGDGTLLWVYPSAPDPLPASFFNGLCVIGSADLIIGHSDKNSSLVLMLDAYQIIGPAIIPYSVKAAALLQGIGFTSGIADAQLNVQAYMIEEDVVIPEMPWSPYSDPNTYRDGLSMIFRGP